MRDSAISGQACQGEDDFVDFEKCPNFCKKSKVQCVKEKGHDGRHSFTPKNCLSATTIAKLLKDLTSGQMKSLAGLDVTDTKCGRENFVQMRTIVENLVGVVHYDIHRSSFDKEQLIAEIDQAEEFHKNGFARHLGGMCLCLVLVLFL